MKGILPLFAAITVVLLVSGPAAAQTRVYETREADGEPAFSDVPSGESRAIDIPATNIAEPASAGDARDRHGSERPIDAAAQEGPNITIVGDSSASKDVGDGFVEKQTPEGAILVNQRERDELDRNEVIYRGSHRIVIEEPRPHKKQK